MCVCNIMCETSHKLNITHINICLLICNLIFPEASVCFGFLQCWIEFSLCLEIYEAIASMLFINYSFIYSSSLGQGRRHSFTHPFTHTPV